MKINIIGLGYIGLPTSLILASKGNKVVGTDLNSKLISTLNNNKVTFEEEGLFDLFLEARNNGIEFSENYQNADTYIITVPTPYDSDTKKIDSSYIESAVKTILDICNDDVVLIIESTVSPGTIQKTIRPIIANQGKRVNLVHAPERILPGAMLSELVNNSRTIGVDSLEVGNTVVDLYKTFCEGEIVVTDIPTAEMSKVVENTFRDINIAFANELAQISREAGLDVYEVIKIANKHPRVNILQPGPGVGGHCISVDPWFLVGDYPNHTNLIKKARDVNDNMPAYIHRRIVDVMKENGIDSFNKVGLYGITYKENVDDTRESPTLQLLDLFPTSDFVTYDPMLQDKIMDTQVLDFSEFLESIDMLVVMVGHDHIKNIAISGDLIILDTKNILSDNSKYSL